MPPRVIWRYGALAFTATLLFVVLSGWVQPLPVITVPLLVGGMLGLQIKRWDHAAIVGGAVGVMGTVISRGTGATLAAMMSGMQDWFWKGVAKPLFGTQPLHGGVGTSVVLAVLCAVVAGSVSYLLGVTKVRRMRVVAAWVTVGIAAACLVYTGLFVSGGLRQEMRTEPVSGEYGFDAHTYVKTFYLMKSGMGYYEAIVEATEGDARGLESGEWARDGKMRWWMPRPSYFRTPVLFWTWQVMSPTASAIVVWSLTLAAGSMLVLFWGFSKHLSSAAVVVPLALYPWLLSHSASLNAFYPDWWAAIATMYAVGLLVRGLIVPSVAVGVLGSLFRFNAVVLPLSVLLALCFLSLMMRTKAVYRMTVWVGGLIAAFGLLWGVHLRKARTYIAADVLAADTTGSMSAAAQRPFAEKAVVPTSYMMYGYGLYLLPLMWLFPLAACGLLLGLRRERVAQLALMVFLVVWFVFLVGVGPLSSYWGQLYTGVLVVGTGTLLAELPRLPWIIAETRAPRNATP